MSKKAQAGDNRIAVRADITPAVHKRLRIAAIEEDVTVKYLVECLIAAYTAQSRKDRNIVRRACQDGLVQHGDSEEIPRETEPENL